MNTYQVGMKGETEAAEYLQLKGYSIIARNFRGKRGEIDAVGKTGPVLVFFEIKTVTSIDFTTVEYLLDSRKRKRIIAVSKEFLFLHPEHSDCCIRYDVLYINNEKKEIRHIENAFFEGGVV
jgi:putative endonuclease